MLNYIEYLGIEGRVGVVLIFGLLVMNIVGEIMEFKGIAVPAIMNIRKYFKKRNQQREALEKLPEFIHENSKNSKTMDDVKALLETVEKHYSGDNISKRNSWMNWVNDEIAKNEKSRAERDILISNLVDTMEKIKQDTLSILIDNKRNAIIDFAARVANKSTSVTREQFNRIFKIHNEYKEIIEANGLTNGEVDIAYRIIEEAYEEHMKHSTFLEDVRGYR